MEPAPDPLRNALDMERLCRGASGGSFEALEQLLWTQHDRLLECARRKVGAGFHGKLDAEDLLQESYVDIFGGIGSFVYQGEDSFYRWASRIIERRFIDQVRRLRAKKRDAARDVRSAGEASAYDALLERCMGDTQTPSRFLRRDEAVNILLSGVAGLPEDYRAVIRRYFLEQAPLSAVAEELGRSEDAVRRLASRAIERLRETLGRASRFLSRVS